MAQAGPAGTLPASKRLLERTEQLAVLEERLGEIGETGRLVLLRGEAGIGKTSVAREFCERLGPPSRILWAGCEPLFTPRALGPFIDIASQADGELSHVVEGGAAPHQVLAALTEDVAAGSPTVLVVEDVHWADEATLDVLRLIGRRISEFPALVIVTYRDDEVDKQSRLRIVLGELARADGVSRVDLVRLSLTAVSELADPYGIDAQELYHRTGGNPFFVSEALAAGTHEVPSTVRDAVLARTAGLSSSAWGLLEALAVVPAAADPRILKALTDDADALNECLNSGVVISSGPSVVFRHELARLVVEESIPPNRSLELHARALRVLEGSSEYAWLAHHADAAADAEAVLRYAPEAARRAAALGAHRESAAQYARALRYVAEAPAHRAELLHARSYECMCSDQVDESIAAAHEALDLRTEIADVGAQAQTLMLLGTVLWCPGYVDEANSAARQAVALLEQHRPEPQALAEAYCEMAGLALDAEDIENALSWAGRALAVLPDPGDEETEIHSRCIIALAHLLKDDPDAPFEIERIRARSLRAGLPEQVCRADENLIWLARRQRDYERVTACLEPALKYASEHGMELWRGYLLAHRAQLELDLGRWDDAAQTAWLILGEPRRSRVPKIIALGVVGRLRARRRDPDLWPVLDMAHDLSNISQELVAAEPVAVARAEAAWLEGDFDRVALETTPAFELARKRSSRYVVAELAVWRRRAGLEDELAPHEVAGPYALELSGAFTEAAARWAALGCQYDAALALAHSNEPDAMREAVQQLQRLGASAAVAMITRRLRQRGVRRIPRGPQKRTGVNPGGVTARELEVLRLLAAGLQNAEIAANLVVSQKTVDHHVSAILRKLSVRNRVAAVAEATRLGLMAPEGSSRR